VHENHRARLGRDVSVGRRFNTDRRIDAARAFGEDLTTDAVSNR